MPRFPDTFSYGAVMRFNHRCNGYCRDGIHAQVMYVDPLAAGIAVDDLLDVVEGDMERAFRAAGLTLHGCDLAPEAKPPDHLIRAAVRTESAMLTPNDWQETPPSVVGVLLRFADPNQPTPDQIEEAASATGAWPADEEE